MSEEVVKFVEMSVVQDIHCFYSVKNTLITLVAQRNGMLVYSPSFLSKSGWQYKQWLLCHNSNSAETNSFLTYLILSHFSPSQFNFFHILAYLAQLNFRLLSTAFVIVTKHMASLIPQLMSLNHHAVAASDQFFGQTFFLVHFFERCAWFLFVFR